MEETREKPRSGIRRERAHLSPIEEEVLDLIFKLGVANSWQIRAMLSKRYSGNWIRQTLTSLSNHRNGKGGDPLLEGTPVSTAWESSSGRPLNAYYLSEAGLRWMAVRRDLDYRRAESDYRKVYRPETVAHSLLRNELFARVCEKVRDDPDYERLMVSALTGESGVDPVEIEATESGRGGGYLNPDGIVEVRSKLSSGGGSRERLIMEADTGTERDDWQLARKAERFGAYIHALATGTQQGGNNLARNTAGSPDDLPRYIFFCPDEERTLWLRRVMFSLADNEDSDLYDRRQKLKEIGIRIADLIWVSNLEWLRREGIDGPSASSLSRNRRTPPMECFHTPDEEPSR